MSSQRRGTAAGPSGCMFEMICADCQSSDAALDVTLEFVNFILSGELPREAFLLVGLLIGLTKSGGGVRRRGFDLLGSARCSRTGGASEHDGLRCRWGRNTRRHGYCGACACVSAC